LGNELPGLEADEHLLARAPASFRGAALTSISSTFSLGSARKRLEAYHAWRMQADGAGFKTAGPEMVLGITERRLVIWQKTFWLGRLARMAGEVPFSAVHEVATVRHGFVTSLAVAFKDGQIVEVETMRGRRLRHLAATMRAALA
jgi:hypothetical protein